VQGSESEDDRSKTKKENFNLGIVIDAIAMGPVVLDVYDGRPAGRY
jgi:hypothetical protein